MGNNTKIKKPRDVLDTDESDNSENVEPANNDHVVQLVEKHNDIDPLSSVSEGSSHAENIDEVGLFTTHAHNNSLGASTYVLPNRQNRGKLQKRYSPNDERERQTRYPIANCVSTQRLSKPIKNLSQVLSSYHIPTRIEKALIDPNWVQAVEEELKA